MTKDELNEILKEDGMYLSPVYNGTFDNVFYVVNESCVEVKFDGVDFIFSRDGGRGYGKKIVAALIEYANTPIEERKPKPQLYNIIIAHDTDSDGAVAAWSKVRGEFCVFDSATDDGLMLDKSYQFTEDEIHKLKQRLSEKEAAIVDLGVTRVKTKKEEGVLPF